MPDSWVKSFAMLALLSAPCAPAAAAPRPAAPAAKAAPGFSYANVVAAARARRDALLAAA